MYQPLYWAFRILGTPSESTWPGVSQLPDFKPTFPQWGPSDLAETIPDVDSIGLELLESFLVYDTSNRMSGE